MPPFTEFAVKEKYTYLHGFDSYHETEAIPGASPLVNNSPQKPSYGLRTERISGTSFTAPREQLMQTWMYRANPSLDHSKFEPIQGAPAVPSNVTPDSYMWPTFPGDDQADWTKQKLLARNGDPMAKTGTGIWVFNIAKDMAPRTAFSSLDGDCLIIPQAGALDIQTELGKLLVRQNEIAVIPRGIRYRITLPAGPARGYICELFQGHYKLPDLGAIGSTGLANVRDFQIPKAYFEGQLHQGTAYANDEGEWTIISRLAGRLWSCTQNSTPFDVAAWHGTNYPYKYDLGRFCVLENAAFDEHDPSLYVVLTAPTYAEPGHGVVDFAYVPPRWKTSEDTLWIPYYHRNAMSEFFGPIITSQDPKHPLNVASKNNEFAPFAAGLNGCLTPHGASEEEFQKASNQDLKPRKDMNEGMSIFLLETYLPLYVSDWADEVAVKNFGGRNEKPKAAKM
ncbi:hypothetical protein M409DRAFT_70243 [Zasmidium cellare ATCC 36951]|uniref:homogentisate 1,2-dioxygenase n=1 Tax=Zasmidium cellare ATCC 36951 TaxID=1080233 RepID=A0A6A6C5P1_ZASCE|nr:uncharacterized protein M409DRAFT_70243 [Zasmidium cellare ATCC 36951]KAF2160706.1 hypothetical protein M409DRAFT_70243 [Zasmidium cellare ATCC 36951]